MSFYQIEGKQFEEQRVTKGYKKSIGSIRFMRKIDQNVLNAKLCFYA